MGEQSVKENKRNAREKMIYMVNDYSIFMKMFIKGYMNYLNISKTCLYEL